jgi:serine/threonine protein kinase
MGVVYKARDQDLKRVVALKMIRAEGLSANGLLRFRAEAESIARLRHPHIVQVFTTGSQAGRPFFVMEYLDGGSLAGQVHGRPQPPRDAARLVLLLARAVHAVHQQGILHRDLKPANVLLAAPADEPALNTAWGYPKVADFGLARQVDQVNPLTATGQAVGTPAHMAPEQVRGEPGALGPTTDVYSLGTILYELLAGRRPFHAESHFQLTEQIVHQPATPPSRGQPGISPDLDRICLKCLAKAPADRYPTAAALADDLGHFLAQPPAEQPRAAPPVPSRRRRLAWLLAGAAALALVALAVWLSGHGRSEDSSQEPAPLPTALKVLSLDVKHYANVGGKFSKLLGVLGEDSFTTRREDWVTVQARLSRPAHAYLIAFRPDDTAELCFPGSESEPPPLTDRPRYPLLGDDVIGLTEGEGLAVFAAVVSSQALPAYKSWRPPGPSPWKRHPALPGVVLWQEDAGVQGWTETHPRSKGQKLPGRAGLAELTDWLRRGPQVEAVAAIGFAVAPKGDR